MVARHILPVLLAAGFLSGQNAPPPVFEVASIKPSSADAPSGSGGHSGDGRLTYRNVTLKRCIRGAYGIPESQIRGGPKWIDENRYDIDAKASFKAGDDDLMRMLRALLADRFQLTLHRENRQVSGYAITVAKSGLKMKKADPDAPSKTNGSRGRLDAQACTIAVLAQKLADILKTPVVDASGTEGAFNFSLQWAPDEMRAKADVPSGPSIFSAVEEQLGVKLESRKVAAEILVIDRAELPSEN